MALRAGQENPLTGFEVVWKPLSELVNALDPRNPRAIDDGAMARLVNSIREHGFLLPIAFNERTALVVGGHQRIEAAQILGLEGLPCVLGDWEEAEAEAIGLALNAEYGQWDELKRAETLARLRAHNVDLDLTCLPAWDLDAISAHLPTLPSALPPARKSEERRFTVSYLADDEPSLCAFLGVDELPQRNRMGERLLERIRALET